MPTDNTFQQPDTETVESSELTSTNSNQDFNLNLEKNLICPVNLCIFLNPVVLIPSGITVEEQTALELLAKNSLCPLTRKPITGYVENNVLKSMVGDFLQQFPQKRSEQFVPGEFESSQRVEGSVDLDQTQDEFEDFVWEIVENQPVDIPRHPGWNENLGAIYGSNTGAINAELHQVFLRRAQDASVQEEADEPGPTTYPDQNVPVQDVVNERLDYDRFGNLISRTILTNTDQEQGSVTTYHYDAFGRPRSPSTHTENRSIFFANTSNFGQEDNSSRSAERLSHEDQPNSIHAINPGRGINPEESAESDTNTEGRRFSF